MKYCSGCKLTKESKDFHKGGCPKGLSGVCRSCSSLATKERAKTSEGLVKRIYNNQRMTTRKMGRTAPEYSSQDLYAWIISQSHFEGLYAAWVESGYTKFLIPSVDRKNNTISYTLDNIQLTTWRENLDNQKIQNISGEYLHSDSKAVRQLSLDGVYLQTFPSIAIAMRAMTGSRTGVSNISSVCNGKWKTAYGFRWEWELS